jgi:hypothetical protein
MRHRGFTTKTPDSAPVERVVLRMVSDSRPLASCSAMIRDQESASRFLYGNSTSSLIVSRWLSSLSVSQPAWHAARFSGSLVPPVIGAPPEQQGFNINLMAPDHRSVRERERSVV